jgi:uncharacterized protein DUF87
MQDFEKLGAFYLGRVYDLDAKQQTPELLLYDSKDLVTHAVCVGMTGSGKTGLCITLVEEAAIDGIPAIVIDPKGDLSNLLLTFPELRPDDFAPWINEDDARRQGLAPNEFAAAQAELWKRGLSEWGQDGDRIRRLRDAAEFAIYTPGSEAGLPVSILRSFAVPDSATRDDVEAFRERVANTATSLLGLLQIDADPVRSRDHILISTILDRAWRAGQELDLAALVQQIQSPGIQRVGVVDLESFFPAKERSALAMSLNNLLAAPSFSAWLEGEPLDIGSLLHTPTGKPRVAIFSIAHLGDAERMFFVSLLLNQTIGWMRTQPGTSSLRALLYMDEIFGFFPPVANPPSKAPLLTLLKQARAYGLGVVLATQNPVDLDYKGLSNAGTWLIGRLQAERDKARLLDGLEGAAASSRGDFNRAEIERTISSLSSRVFLMNNVHESAPEVFQTRWTLSYLRGPLARTEIKKLMDAKRGAARAAAEGARPDAAVARSVASGAVPGGEPVEQPVLPPEIPQYFIPPRKVVGRLVYRPSIAGAVQIRFSDAKAKIDLTRDLLYLTPLSDEAALPVDWQHAEESQIGVEDLEKSAADGARYEPVASAATRPKNYQAWGRDLANWVYQTQTVELLKSGTFGVVSQPGESERDFRVRLHQSAREERDRLKEQLRQKYAPKIAALEERQRRTQQTVERESEQASSRKVQTAISLGATLLSAVFGRKAVGVGTIGRATTTARDVGRSMKEAQDVDRARETLEAVQQQRTALEAQLQEEVTAFESRTDAGTEALQTIVMKPKKSDIGVRLVALVWAPYSEGATGERTPAY